MSILKVARMGHPVLRQVAEPIPPNEIKSERIQRLIDDMFETMAEYSGVGLAAPQVHQSVRLLVTEDIPDPDSDDGYLARRSVVINPEITFLTEEQIAFFEGCLSIPDIRFGCRDWIVTGRRSIVRSRVFPLLSISTKPIT